MGYKILVVFLASVLSVVAEKFDLFEGTSYVEYFIFCMVIAIFMELKEEK